MDPTLDLSNVVGYDAGSGAPIYSTDTSSFVQNGLVTNNLGISSAPITTTSLPAQATGLNAQSNDGGGVFSSLWNTATNTFNSAVGSVEGYYNSIAQANLHNAQAAANQKIPVVTANGVTTPGILGSPSSQTLVLAGVAALALILILK